jgi:hypothetical protein
MLNGRVWEVWWSNVIFVACCSDLEHRTEVDSYRDSDSPW